MTPEAFGSSETGFEITLPSDASAASAALPQGNSCAH